MFACRCISRQRLIVEFYLEIINYKVIIAGLHNVAVGSYCLRGCLSLFLCTWLSVYVCMCLWLCVCLSEIYWLSVSLNLSNFLSVCLWVCVYVCLFVWVFLSVLLSLTVCAMYVILYLIWVHHYHLTNFADSVCPAVSVTFRVV